MGMTATSVGEGVSGSDTTRATRLLLAEDDELLRRVFARAFRAEGYEVGIGASIRDARLFLVSGRPAGNENLAGEFRDLFFPI